MYSTLLLQFISKSEVVLSTNKDIILRHMPGLEKMNKNGREVIHMFNTYSLDPTNKNKGLLRVYGGLGCHFCVPSNVRPNVEQIKISAFLLICIGCSPNHSDRDASPNSGLQITGQASWLCLDGRSLY